MCCVFLSTDGQYLKRDDVVFLNPYVEPLLKRDIFGRDGACVPTGLLCDSWSLGAALPPGPMGMSAVDSCPRPP